MIDQPPADDLEEMIAETEAIEAAIQQAVWEALAEHKRAGNPVVGWEEGQVCWIAAEDLDLDALARQAD